MQNIKLFLTHMQCALQELPKNITKYKGGGRELQRIQRNILDEVINDFIKNKLYTSIDDISIRYSCIDHYFYIIKELYKLKKCINKDYILHSKRTKLIYNRINDNIMWVFK